MRLKSQLELDRCPHCSVDRPSLQQMARFETMDYRGANPRIWCSYACARCGGVVVGSAQKGDANASVREIFPPPREVDNALPERAKEYLAQALNSLNAPAGAVMLTASSIDAMLQAKGYTDGSLYSRIDKASTEHVITADMALWAHEVRLDANDQRHADVGASLPSVEDARLAIEFATSLGQFMFVLPLRVRRGIEKAKAS